jgi:hypothetical protein
VALKPIPTDFFSFRDNTFVAEESTLRGNGYRFNSYIKLINPKTGKEVEFDLYEVDRDREGDAMGFRFKARGTKHANLRILVIND